MAGATYAETLDAFTNFLTAYVHTLLYLRSLYPRTSFVHSRFHNTSAYQSRHPLVCHWIRDAIEAVRTELLDGTVSRIGIVIFHYGNGSKIGKNGSGGSEESVSKGTGDVQIMERFMIDVSAFPVVDKGDRNAVMKWGSRPSSQASSRSGSPAPGDEAIDDEDSGQDQDEEDREEHPQWHGDGEGTPTRSHLANHHLNETLEPASDTGVDTNLSEQMRAALVSLTTRCAQLKPLPDKCSFNICMELKDEADVDPPVGHPQAWMPVQPSLQKIGRKAVKYARVEDEGEELTQESRDSEDRRRRGEDLGGLRFTPIRTVETGTFRFETWVEEGRAKFEEVGEKAQEKPNVSIGKPKVGVSVPSKEKAKVSFPTSSGDSITKY